FYFVLDRETGEFISAEPFVFVNWATGYDSTGRPIVNPNAVYREAPAVVFPSMVGAHNWQPMAFNPETGLAYIPAREEGMVILSEPQYKWKPGATNIGSGAFMAAIADALPEATRTAFRGILEANPDLPGIDPQEVLIAYDPVAQQERWRVPLGTTDWSGGGVLTTGGNLVIQGTSAGFLVAYRADTGEKLAEIEVGTAIMAAPVTYEMDGEQYVAVVAGLGGAIAAAMHPPRSAPYRYQNYGRILAFKLGGGKVPLPPARMPQTTPEPPAAPGYSEQLAARGEAVWSAAGCVFCHGAYGETRLSAYPDLYRMSVEIHAAFDSIVLGGKLASTGMAGFSDVLTAQDVAAIHA
ncbi:MAG: PQQ-dependent dehydrogenase, methanol/ethanol family, partial [Anaerolineales bacterium]